MEINIWHRDLGDGPAGRLSPRWDNGMSKKEAKKLIRVAAGNGVRVFGSIRCALKLCPGPRDEEHRCARRKSE